MILNVETGTQTFDQLRLRRTIDQIVIQMMTTGFPIDVVKQVLELRKFRPKVDVFCGLVTLTYLTDEAVRLIESGVTDQKLSSHTITWGEPGSVTALKSIQQG
jgi:hypothetical protein